MECARRWPRRFLALRFHPELARRLQSILLLWDRRPNRRWSDNSCNEAPEHHIFPKARKLPKSLLALENPPFLFSALAIEPLQSSQVAIAACQHLRARK